MRSNMFCPPDLSGPFARLRALASLMYAPCRMTTKTESGYALLYRSTRAFREALRSRAVFAAHPSLIRPRNASTWRP